MASIAWPNSRTSIRWGGEESGGWLIVQVGGEGIAESSAGSCEVISGQGGGVGGGHDARVVEQWPVGGVGLGCEHIEPEAAEVSGVEVGEGGPGVEETAAGDVDEPDAGAHGSEHGVVNEGRLPGLITGRDDDGVDIGDALEESVGGVDGGEWRDGTDGAGADDARGRTGE
jgi:hypothetical protein